jgi:DNA-binding NtrC family response regulator
MTEQQGLAGLEVLVVDADTNVINGLNKLLSEKGFMVTGLTDVKEAENRLREKFFAVVICDLDTPEPNDGLKMVQAVRNLTPASAVIVLTPRRAYDAAVMAFRANADDVVAKSPDQVGYLVKRVQEAAREHRLDMDRTDLLKRIGQAHEQFLNKMMDMFKMVMDLQDRVQGRDSAARSGMTTCSVLVVDPDPRLTEYLQNNLDADKGWDLMHCQTGGEALDHIGRRVHHVVLLKNELPDLPTTMVARTVKAQSPEAIVLELTPPGDKPGRVEVIESTTPIQIIDEFSHPEQLLESLDTLRSAFQAKAKERRYLQAFRAQHYEFLKRYAELKGQLSRLA